MSGKNFLRIPDCVSFSFTNPALVQVKDDYEGAFKAAPPSQTHPSGLGQVAQLMNPQSNPNPLKSGLQVRIAATHAGIVTRNNGFYLPDRMQKGAASFTENYPKPVLVHHDDHSDPVGRVIVAKYIDTSGMIHDKYNGLIVKNRYGKEVGQITETLNKDFVGGRMPFGMQVDTVLSVLRDSILEDDGFEGLGHIQLVLNITDAEAIQKFLDGRYLTGSVGANTDKAICSVCRQDWTETGPCEHKPGGIYDGVKCFIIAGSLLYDEYSVVNVPADKYAKVLELNYNGVRDSITIENAFAGRAYEVQPGFPQYDSVPNKEEGMKVKDAVQTAEKPEGTVEAVVTEETKPSEVVMADSAPQPDPAPVAEPTTAETQTEESFDDFLTRVWDTKKMADEDAEKLYELLWKEAEEAVQAGELEAHFLTDAKLSAEKRKGLAKSTFCGPGRSFPVPDCAHVTAARRLIGRYKGPGDKSAILACVARKAKALGCGGAKDEAAPANPPVEQPQVAEPVAEPTITPVTDSVQLPNPLDLALAAATQGQPLVKDGSLPEEELARLQKLIKRLVDLVGQENMSKVLVAEGLAMDPACENQLLDEIVKQEELVGTLREELAALRKEYESISKDLHTTQDSLVEARVVTRKIQEAHLSTLSTLRDGKVEQRDFSTLDDTALSAEVERTLKVVDMTKITDKLGNGMAREPVEGVTLPAGVQVEQSPQKDSDTGADVIRQLAQIEEHYMALMFKDKVAAEQFRNMAIGKLRSEGKLPKDE